MENIKKGTLILEGGAARGVFTAGVLDYLLEKDLMFSDVIGVSAGSMNTLGYVAGQPGRTKSTLIMEDGTYKSTNIRAFNKNKTILDMELMFHDFAHDIFPVDFDSFFGSGVKTHIVTTNCETGRAQYHIEKEDKYHLMKLCRASSSLPLVTPIVRINDIPCLDGGLADAVPIRYARNLHNSKIVIILTRNPGYRKKPMSVGMRKIYEKAYGKYPEFIKLMRRRVGEYNRTMELIEKLESEGKVFVIRPQIPTIGRMEKDLDKLNGFYDHGYQLMEKEYDTLMKYLETQHFEMIEV